MLSSKTALRALSLVLVLVFAVMAAGCSANNPNPIVLKVGSVNVGMVKYYSLYNSYKDLYSNYGLYDVSTTESLRDFQDMIFDYLVESYLPLNAALAAGVALTDEEKATALEGAAADIKSYIEAYASSVDASITDADKIYQEELKLFKKDLRNNGWTYKSYTGMIEQNYIDQAIATKFMESKYDESVSVTEDDVLAYYQQKVQTEMETYAETPAQYYTDYSNYLNGTGIAPLTAPEGYRYCKHILIKFAAEGETKDVDAIVAEVKSKLEAGEDFDALVAEYGEDPGMKSEPYMSTGYLMSNDIIDKYYEGFGAAAMALENVGDVSEPVETTAGYHFIQYSSDVSTETATFNNVESTLTEAYTNEKKTEVYDALIAEWLESTEITKYYTRVSNVR